MRCAPPGRYSFTDWVLDRAYVISGLGTAKGEWAEGNRLAALWIVMPNLVVLLLVLHWLTRWCAARHATAHAAACGSLTDPSGRSAAHQGPTHRSPRPSAPMMPAKGPPLPPHATRVNDKPPSPAPRSQRPAGLLLPTLQPQLGGRTGGAE